MARQGTNVVWWVIAVSLAAIAIQMAVKTDSGSGLVPMAFGQPVTQAGARGIFAFSGQLTSRTYGVFMVDVDSGTIWCYEYSNGTQEMRLVAGRSWLHDRYLENYKCEEPSPEKVQEIIEMERQNKLRASQNRARNP